MNEKAANPTMSMKVHLSWWQWILAADLFLIMVLVLKLYHFPGIWRIAHYFNLSVEMNGAVWWSATCLLATGLMAYGLYCRNEGKEKFAWLVLAIVLAGLSLDEIGSIHERVSAGVDRGWLDLLPYGLVLVSLVAYVLTCLFREASTRRAALFISAAFLAFGSAALQEHLANIGIWPPETEGLRLGAEEGSELMGSLLLFLGIAPQLSRSKSDSFRIAVPNPFQMRHVPAVMFGGWLIHSLASVISPTWIDIAEKGNPLAWYPIVVFFLLFSAAFWKCLDSSTEKPNTWAVLSVFFLICSLSFSFPPAELLPVVGSSVPLVYLPGLFLFSLVSLFLILSLGIPGFLSHSGKYGLTLLLLPALCLLVKTPEVQFFAYGLLAYLAFLIYWRGYLITGRDEIK